MLCKSCKEWTYHRIVAVNRKGRCRISCLRCLHIPKRHFNYKRLQQIYQRREAQRIRQHNISVQTDPRYDYGTMERENDNFLSDFSDVPIKTTIYVPVVKKIQRKKVKKGVKK